MFPPWQTQGETERTTVSPYRLVSLKEQTLLKTQPQLLWRQLLWYDEGWHLGAMSFLIRCFFIWIGWMCQISSWAVFHILQKKMGRGSLSPQRCLRPSLKSSELLQKCARKVAVAAGPAGPAAVQRSRSTSAGWAGEHCWQWSKKKEVVGKWQSLMLVQVRAVVLFRVKVGLESTFSAKQPRDF